MRILITLFALLALCITTHAQTNWGEVKSQADKLASEQKIDQAIELLESSKDKILNEYGKESKEYSACVDELYTKYYLACYTMGKMEYATKMSLTMQESNSLKILPKIRAQEATRADLLKNPGKYSKEYLDCIKKLMGLYQQAMMTSEYTAIYSEIMDVTQGIQRKKTEPKLVELTSQMSKIESEKGKENEEYLKVATELAGNYASLGKAEEMQKLLGELGEIRMKMAYAELNAPPKSDEEILKEMNEAKPVSSWKETRSAISDFKKKRYGNSMIVRWFEDKEDKLPDPVSQPQDYLNTLASLRSVYKSHSGQNYEIIQLYSKGAVQFETHLTTLDQGSKDYIQYLKYLEKIYQSAKDKENLANTHKRLNQALGFVLSSGTADSWKSLQQELTKIRKGYGYTTEDDRSLTIIEIYEKNKQSLMLSSLDDEEYGECINLVSDAYRRVLRMDDRAELWLKSIAQLESFLNEVDPEDERTYNFEMMLYKAYAESGQRERARQYYEEVQVRRKERLAKMEAEREKDDVMDPMMAKIYQAFSSGNTAEVIELFESVPTNSQTYEEIKSNTALMIVISGAYQQLGQTDKSNALGVDPMQYLIEQADSPESKQMFLAMQQMTNNAKAYQAKTKAREEKYEMENQAQIASIRDDLGIADSIPIIDRQQQTADMMTLYKDIDYKKMGYPDSISQYYQTIHEKGYNATMKDKMSLSNASEEEKWEMVIGMIEEFNKYRPKNKKVTLPDDISLDEAFEILDMISRDTYDTPTEHYNNQIKESYEQVKNPQGLADMLDSMITMFGGYEWVEDWQFEAFESLVAENKTNELSLKESKELAVRYLSSKKPAWYNAQNVKALNENFDRAYQHSQESYKKMMSLYGGYFVSEEPAEIDVIASALDNRQMAVQAPQWRILASELRKAKGLLNLDDIKNEALESNKLDEMAKYRNVYMNAMLKAMEETDFDIFNDENSLFGFNSLMVNKGANYRTMKFLLEGTKNAANPRVKELYSDIQSRKEELGKVHQLSDSLQKAIGWDSARLSNEIQLVKEEQRQLYQMIAKEVDFVDFAMQWVITWQDIQALLEPGEAFVDVQRIQNLKSKTRSTYLYSIIRHEGRPTSIVYAKGRSIDGNARNYLETIESPKKNFFKVLWGPLDSALNNISKLYFSADGAYHQVALEGLYDEDSKKFLSEKLQIIRLSEHSEIRLVKNSAVWDKAGKDIQIFGHPEYDQSPANSASESTVDTEDTKRIYFANEMLDELPGTIKEVKSIAKLAGEYGMSAHTYMDKDATEAALKSLSSPEILHIATHGSFIALKKDEDKNLAFALEKYIENPLLRSRLFLAGANKTLSGDAPEGDNDGIVSAEDIAHLDLSGTELVVMSACETGLGETFDGEGIFGLQRSFILAGAKTVIMSLWQVSDEATMQLMTNFYTNLLEKNMTKRDAFSSAQETLRKKYPEPYYWAAFVMVGV